MKYPIVTLISLVVIAPIAVSFSDTNAPAVHAKEIQAQINQQAFAQGVRFGLLAKQKNMEILDANLLTQIAWSLFVYHQQALEQQRATKVPSETNAAPTNAVPKVEEE